MPGRGAGSESSPGASDARARPGVSIVCVFNDAEVRKACLDRSIDDHRFEGIDVELIAVDNRQQSFATAGAALNHGASLATRDYLAFVHQDVYLHSLSALSAAAGLLQNPDIGMLGSVGIRSDGVVIGRIRDRVLLIGQAAQAPTAVDSLDEVLFLVSKARWQADPICSSSDLAWHAYAVEYGVRMASRGLLVAAIDIPVTHNSLTTNLAKLDQAHAAVARMYPARTPVRTTCGTVGVRSDGWRTLPLVRSQGWRYRWLKESIAVREVLRHVPALPVVLSDIRQNIDSIIAASPHPLQVFNLDRTPRFGEQLAEPLELTRLGRTLTVASASVEVVLEALAGTSPEAPMLLTNLLPVDLQQLAGRLRGRRAILGYHGETGIWLALGEACSGDVAEWRSSRARPLSAAASVSKAR